jgi:hypothetical protein
MMRPLTYLENKDAVKLALRKTKYEPMLELSRKWRSPLV